MHYKNGRPAQVGDKVLVAHDTYSTLGVVIAANPKSDTCNLTIVPLRDSFSATAGECVRLDDASSPTAYVEPPAA